MTNDALVALADSWQRAADQMESEGDYRAAVFPRHYAKQLREALAAPAAPKGVDEAMVERALDAYLRVQDAGESLYGCVTSALTAAITNQEQSND